MEGSIRRALRTYRGSLPETAFSSCFTCSLMSVKDQRKKCYFQLFHPSLPPPHSRQVVLGSLLQKGRTWPITSFALIGFSNTYGCHTGILGHHQVPKKNKAAVGKGVEIRRKKKTRNKTNSWIFIRSLNKRRLSKCKQWEKSHTHTQLMNLISIKEKYLQPM